MAETSEGITCCGKLRDERYCGGCGKCLTEVQHHGVQRLRPGRLVMFDAFAPKGIVPAGITLDLKIEGREGLLLLTCGKETRLILRVVEESMTLVEVWHPEAVEGGEPSLEYIVYPPDKIGPYEREKNES